MFSGTQFGAICCGRPRTLPGSAALDVSGAQRLLGGHLWYISCKWTRTGFTWEPGGTAGCRWGRPECAACSPTGLGAQACKGSPCLPADPPVPEAAPWELVLWSTGSGGARGWVTPGRALAPWVLRTVGGQERLCPSGRRLRGSGCGGQQGPSSGQEGGHSPRGAQTEGPAGWAGGLRAGSLPLLQSRHRLVPPGASAPAQACCPHLKQNTRTHPAGLWWEPEGTPQVLRKQRRSSQLFNLALYVEVSVGSRAVVKNSTQRAQVRSACLPP